MQIIFSIYHNFIKPYRTLLRICFVHIFLSVLYTFYMVIHGSKWSKKAMLLHISLLIGWMATVTVLLGILTRTERIGKWGRKTLMLIPSLSSCALITLYIANIISNKYWGNSVSYKVLGQLDFRLGITIQGEGLIPVWTYLLIPLFITCVTGIYIWLSNGIYAGLEELFLSGRPHSLFRDPARSRRSVLILAFCAICFSIYCYYLTRDVYQLGLIRYEPITAFFSKDFNIISSYEDYKLSLKVRQTDADSRASYPKGLSFQKKNVILITVDCLRADHMQVYGYKRPNTPFLSSLVESGKMKKVDMALSTCAESNCGILSSLNSKTFRHIIPQNFKLSDLLQDQGYKVYFILSGNHFWYDLKDSYSDSMTLYFDGTKSSKYSINDDRVLLEGLEKVPDYANTPSFFYFHMMSVHLNGYKQAEYTKFRPSKSVLSIFDMFLEKNDRKTVINNYDNGVLQTDQIIQQLFSVLEKKGYLKDSIVMITGDHGEGLGERGRYSYGHVRYLYQEFIHVPLLIYDDADYQNLSFARQIDIAPTIVDRLGLPVPPSWHGSSLLRPSIPDFSLHQTKKENPCYAVFYNHQDKLFKYIYCVQNPVDDVFEFIDHNKRKIRWTEELYELRSDPAEAHNLIQTADPQILKLLRERLKEYRNATE